MQAAEGAKDSRLFVVDDVAPAAAAAAASSFSHLGEWTQQVTGGEEGGLGFRI